MSDWNWGLPLATENRVLLEKAFEVRAKAIPLGGDKLLCRVLGDLMLYVAAVDTTLTPHLAMEGYWEIWVTQAIAKFVKPGMACVDVGANCGYFSILMAALVGDKGRVKAFEPQHELVQLLRMSASSNGYTQRVACYPLAVGDTEGEVSLKVDPTALGNAYVSVNGAMSVQQTTLDVTLAGSSVDFIKIDAEGSEPRIWAGMQETLKRCNPAVLMEYSRPMYVDPDWIRGALDGYRVRSVEGDGSLKPRTFDEIVGSPELWMLWIDRPPPT